LKNSSDDQTTLEEIEVEKLVNAVVSSIPANQDRLNVYRQAQAEDCTCSKLIVFYISGWPVKNAIKGEIKRFWQAGGELALDKYLLLYGSRIVIPMKMQKETLEKIHSGHQGMLRCRLRISELVWWPGVSKQIEQFIKDCAVC